jgi:hypothetical protein
MTLADQIIDEAEELAELFPDASEDEILKTIREVTRVDFARNSTCERLALAAFWRIRGMQNNLKSVTTVNA